MASRVRALALAVLVVGVACQAGAPPEDSPDGGAVPVDDSSGESCAQKSAGALTSVVPTGLYRF